MAKLRKCPFCGESIALEQRPSYWKIGHMCNDGASYICVIDEDPEKAVDIWNGGYAVNYKPDLKTIDYKSVMSPLSDYQFLGFQDDTIEENQNGNQC